MNSTPPSSTQATATPESPDPSGPHVVAIGGGHGLAATLRAVRRYAGSITAVVSVADDGGSTGKLRAVTDRAAPGDLRKCLVALAGEDNLITQALEYRFLNGELDGHAFGNLMIVALQDTGGDLVKALDTLGGLIDAVGRVLPTTTEPVTLWAQRKTGDRVEGQVEVMAYEDLSSVGVTPETAVATPEAVAAIAAADQLIVGPGSLYTSVLAATAVPGIAEAINNATAPLVYVCNLKPQKSETMHYNVDDHVAALNRNGLHPDVVLYDPASIGGTENAPTAVGRQLARPHGLAHDSELLSAALHSLIASS